LTGQPYPLDHHDCLFTEADDADADTYDDSDLALTRYCQYFIVYCNKGGRGENILRNIVGNKGGLGGGYCTIMCNNAPFFVSRTIFSQTPPPIQNPTTKANKKIPPNTSKHLQNTSKSGGGVQ